MDSISLVAGEWAVDDVGWARTLWDRWRGLRGDVDHRGLLIRTRSVHGFGLRTPLLAVGITSEMRVASLRPLLPGRVVFFPGVRFVLELPHDATPPRVGSTVEIRDG